MITARLILLTIWKVSEKTL